MKFYRYENFRSGSYDEELDINSSSTRPVLIQFSLLRETNCGYWIVRGNSNFLDGQKRWIPKKSKKRYAYPTIDEAKNNYILRCKKRKAILQSQIDHVNQGLSIIDYVHNENLKKITL